MMMDSKNDLYRTEWLELVFAGRNKAYGAYEMRKHNSLTSLKALLAGAAMIISAVTLPFIYSKLTLTDNIVSAVPPDTDYDLKDFTLPPRPTDPPVEPRKSISPPAETMPTTRFVPMKVVSPAEVIEEMPAMTELDGMIIGQQNIAANIGSSASNATEDETLTSTSGVVSNPDELVGLEMLEKYPEFPGGQAAFSKYISRNLRYPMMARENAISGRVFVSFIIEQNGSLSNIKVLRGIGGGCDEEVMRVLKNSPAWNAGIQNGRKVRVAYTMPMFFQLAE